MQVVLLVDLIMQFENVKYKPEHLVHSLLDCGFDDKFVNNSRFVLTDPVHTTNSL